MDQQVTNYLQLLMPTERLARLFRGTSLIMPCVLCVSRISCLESDHVASAAWACHCDPVESSPGGGRGARRCR